MPENRRKGTRIQDKGLRFAGFRVSNRGIRQFRVEIERIAWREVEVRPVNGSLCTGIAAAGQGSRIGIQKVLVVGYWNG